MHTSIVQYNKNSSQQLLSYRIREKVIKTILLLNTIMVFAFNDQKNILYIVKASLLIIDHVYLSSQFDSRLKLVMRRPILVSNQTKLGGKTSHDRLKCYQRAGEKATVVYH